MEHRSEGPQRPSLGAYPKAPTPVHSDSYPQHAPGSYGSGFLVFPGASPPLLTLLEPKAIIISSMLFSLQSEEAQ